MVGIYVGNTADEIRNEAARSFTLGGNNSVLHTSGGAAMSTHRGDVAGLAQFGYLASSLDVEEAGQRCYLSESPFFPLFVSFLSLLTLRTCRQQRHREGDAAPRRPEVS